MWRGVCLIGAMVALPVAASAQQPCTTDARRVVAEVYQRVLERPYDTRGENLVTQLAAGQTTVREIVRAVARLPEHHQRFLAGGPTTAVENLYKHILGRQPDPTGLHDHVQGAQKSGIGAVLDAFINSGEYAQNFGDFGVPGSSVRYCGPGQASSAVRGNRNMRFAGMDANNNGQIERSEWNGTRESFVVQDWNGDNVLSGDEVVPGARRAARQAQQDQQAPGAFNSWNAQTFTTLDRNNDGRIAATEWRYDTASFVDADRNGDGILSRTEFLNGEMAQVANDVVDTENDFTVLDTNRNGRVERNEWRSSDDAFQWLDRNNDGFLSRVEVLGNQGARDRFTQLDVNGDNRLTFDEFNGTRRSFNQQDANSDGILSRREFNQGGAVPTTGR